MGNVQKAPLASETGELFADCQLTKRQKGNTSQNINMCEENHLIIILQLEKREELPAKCYKLSRKKKTERKHNREAKFCPFSKCLRILSMIALFP